MIWLYHGFQIELRKNFRKIPKILLGIPYVTHPSLALLGPTLACVVAHPKSQEANNTENINLYIRSNLSFVLVSDV